MDGKVLSANCDCKAGLGGTCTHVAAILFYLEAAVRIRSSKTVTQEKAYWLLPQRDRALYKPVSNIDFTSSKTKKKKFDKSLENNSPPIATPTVTAKRASDPSEAELATLFSKLHAANIRSAILTVTQPFSNDFVPESSLPKFPQPLTHIKDPKFDSMTQEEVLSACQSVDISVSDEQASAIERATRAQAKCKLWFQYRAGRITTSRMRSVCFTSVSKPSKSLLTAICLPELHEFTTPGTAWGCDHEKQALSEYATFIKSSHHNAQIADSGLVINPEYPHLGASPDGVVSCACCGEGLVEVKCPYCVRDEDAVNHKCLITDDKGVKVLDQTHAYYYQIQTQLFVCEKEFCDFVIWTKSDMHYIRIVPDDRFWSVVSAKAQWFHQKVILPELLCGMFTKNQFISLEVRKDEGSETDIWCLCRKPESGRLAACDNGDCDIVWYHYKCVGLKRKPRGDWFCPKCMAN